jgi:hypothetical protein
VAKDKDREEEVDEDDDDVETDDDEDLDEEEAADEEEADDEEDSDDDDASDDVDEDDDDDDAEDEVPEDDDDDEDDEDDKEEIDEDESEEEIKPVSLLGDKRKTLEKKSVVKSIVDAMEEDSLISPEKIEAFSAPDFLGILPKIQVFAFQLYLVYSKVYESTMTSWDDLTDNVLADVDLMMQKFNFKLPKPAIDLALVAALQQVKFVMPLRAATGMTSSDAQAVAEADEITLEVAIALARAQGKKVMSEKKFAACLRDAYTEGLNAAKTTAKHEAKKAAKNAEAVPAKKKKKKRRPV